MKRVHETIVVVKKVINITYFCVCVCVRARARVRVRVCAFASVCVCVCVCVWMHGSGCMFARL
jgi:hypothetical protein